MIRSIIAVTAATLIAASASAGEQTYNDDGRQVPANRAATAAQGQPLTVERSTVARPGFFLEDGGYVRVVEAGRRQAALAAPNGGAVN